MTSQHTSISVSRNRQTSPSSIVGLIVGLGIVAAPVVSMPGPPENDAGTGTDAPPIGELAWVAWTIGEGHFEGNVTLPHDPLDVFRLQPPRNVIIRVTASADGSALFRLEGPGGGAQRKVGGFHASETRFSAVSGLGGDWNLTVAWDGPGVDPSTFPNRTRYRFSIRYEPHDHFVPLHGGGFQAGAWSIDFPSGVWGRTETFVFGLGDAAKPSRFTHTYYSQRGPGVECVDRWTRTHVPDSLTLHKWLAYDSSTVWTQGYPADVALERPDLSDSPSVLPEFEPGLSTETPDGNFSVRVGTADTEGVGLRGWVVWDGPVPPTIQRRFAQAEFLTLSDFTGDGPGVGAGPYAYAEDVGVNLEIPDAGMGVRALLVDASTPFVSSIPGAAMKETEMTVRVPNGTTLKLTDRHFDWGPARFGPFLDDTNIPEGTWRVEVDHTDGLEAGRVRVVNLSFGYEIPEQC